MRSSLKRSSAAVSFLLDALEGRRMFAFGLTTSASAYTADTGGGLVFSVLKNGATISSTTHLGDLTSAKYNGRKTLATYAQTSHYSHYEQGLTSTAVISAAVAPAGQWIKITCDDSAAASGGVIHSYVAKKGDANPYTASLLSDATNGPGEGRFTGVLPGTYTETLYDNELAVGTRTVTVAAAKTTTADVADTYYTPAALCRIGTWDGTPKEFLDADKINTMHPSDSRMSSWVLDTYTVGTTPDSTFPLAQFEDVNNGTKIAIDLVPTANLANAPRAAGLTVAPAGVAIPANVVWAAARGTINAAGRSVTSDTTMTAFDKKAWYKANESAGTTLADASGVGNAATLAGSFGFVEGVDRVNAVKLTGGSAALPGVIVAGLDDFTLGAWVKPDSLATFSRVFDFGAGTTASRSSTARR